MSCGISPARCGSLLNFDAFDRHNNVYTHLMGWRTSVTHESVAALVCECVTRLNTRTGFFKGGGLSHASPLDKNGK
jgi:hypothetical protein